MKKTFSRLSCVLLAVVMLVGLLPAGMVAFAADDAVTSVTYDFAEVANDRRLYNFTDYNKYTTSQGTDNSEQNPNWRGFDWHDDYNTTAVSAVKQWAGRFYKQTTDNNGKTFVKLADYTNTSYPGLFENPGWVAIKFKSEQPLVPGKYTISFDIFHSGKARNNQRKAQQLTAYVAEYVNGEDEGEYYMTDANKVLNAKSVTVTSKTGESAAPNMKTYSDSNLTFNVTNPNAELVLVLELDGLEIWMDSFKIDRKDGFAEDFSVNFAGLVSSSTYLWNGDTYKEYAEDRIWRFIDTIDYIDGTGADDSTPTKAQFAANLFGNHGFKLKTFTYTEASASKSTAVGKVPPWAAFGFKPESPLQPGEYKVNLKSHTDTSLNNVPVRVYIAEYDSASGKAAADYATEENLAFVGTTVAGGVATADTDTDHSFVLKNPNAELIVIIKMGDTTGQLRMTEFKLTREGDAPEEAPVAPAKTEYDFLADEATSGTCIKALDSYAATLRNWKWLGANDTLLNAIGLNSYGNAKAAGRMTTNGHIEIMPQADEDGTSWHSFVLEAPKAAGIYKLTIETTTQSHTTLGGGESTSEIWVAEYRGGEAGDYMTNENLINSGEKGWINGTVLGSKYISVDEDTEELVFIVKDQGNVAEDKEPKICYEKITLTPVNKNLLTGDVNVYVHSIVNGVAGTEGITATDGIKMDYVNTVAIGEVITLTASGLENKKFSHWQTASGTFLSDNDTYKFKANTNTAVVGVFENAEVADDENVTVSFYDGFGGRIEQKTFDKGTVFSTIAEGVAENFRGYIFSHWASVDDHEANDPVNKNTIAVAQYTADPEAKYTVTINGGESVGYAYNAEVIATSEADNFSYWKRGDKIVSYEKSYTFNVWGNTVLTEVTGVAVEKAPIVILEKDGNEYMVEYSLPDDCSFVEAGIVSSGSVTPTVGSFNKKASSKRLLENHGQFTAKTTDEVVRGYVIYSDADGDLVVAYSE